MGQNNTLSHEIKKSTKILKIIASCETVDQLELVENWINRLVKKGIVSQLHYTEILSALYVQHVAINKLKEIKLKETYEKYLGESE